MRPDSQVYAPALMALALSLVALPACSGGHAPAGAGEESATGSAQGALTVKGSDTMVILAQRWAEAFMAGHEGAVIQVSGGGSGTGLAALINGTANVANASRPIRDRERASIERSRHGQAHETQVALDALAVYVHADNPVQSLSIEQLARIYRAQVHNWSEVGGPDRPIVLYSRENNSGTYAYFKEHVLDNMDFAAEAQTLPGTAAVINAVSRDPGGIGYGGIGYAAGVRPIGIAATDGTIVNPSLESATDGSYPLSRFLNMYTVGEPAGLAAEFITWILTEEGQALVEAVGYYPLPETGSTASEDGPADSVAPAPQAPAGE